MASDERVRNGVSRFSVRFTILAPWMKPPVFPDGKPPACLAVINYIDRKKYIAVILPVPSQKEI